MLTEEEIKKLQARLADLEQAGQAKDRQIAALQGQTTTAALATTVGLTATAKDGDVQVAVTGLVRFRSQVLEVLEKKDEATAIGALSALKDKAGEAAKLADKIVEIEQAALSAEWKGYLDKLSTVGQEGKALKPAKREKAERMALDIGGGALTRKGIDGAKVYVLEMLEPIALSLGGKEIPSQLGLSPEVIKMLEVQGVSPQAFIEFETKRLAGGGR